MVAKRIGARFCGGCNPLIDRSRVVKVIKQNLPEFEGFITDDSKEIWDIGILVCGCQVACADSPEIKKLAKDWIIVGGPLVDLYPVEEEDLPGVITAKCNDLMALEDPSEGSKP